MTDKHAAPVLILAPSGRDAAVAAAILGEVGLVSTVCPHLDALVSGLERAGGAIVTEEALLHSDRRALPGFKWSSQHLERGGCDECSEAAFGSVRARRLALAGSALCCAA